MIVPLVIQSSQPAEVQFRLWHAGLAKWFEITERVQVDSGDALGMGVAGQVVLNVTLPWSGTPELALKQNPLRLAVRHESARRFIVEQSPDLNNWEQWWQFDRHRPVAGDKNPGGKRPKIFPRSDSGVSGENDGRGGGRPPGVLVNQATVEPLKEAGWPAKAWPCRFGQECYIWQIP